jgi:hypothetical protein
MYFAPESPLQVLAKEAAVIGGMMGVHVHPALRMVIGAVLVAVGFAHGRAIAMAVLGVALFVWGAVAWAGGERRPARDEPPR